MHDILIQSLNLPCLHHRLLEMAEAFFTRPHVAVDDWFGHNSSRGDHTHTPLGTQPSLAASTFVPNRHLGESQQDGGHFDPPSGGPEWSQSLTSPGGNPAGPSADLPATQWLAAFRRPPSNPHSPDNPEDRGHPSSKIRIGQPAAAVHPRARPQPARPPYLQVGPGDSRPALSNSIYNLVIFGVKLGP